MGWNKTRDCDGSCYDETSQFPNVDMTDYMYNIGHVFCCATILGLI